MGTSELRMPAPAFNNSFAQGPDGKQTVLIIGLSTGGLFVSQSHNVRRNFAWLFIVFRR